MCIIMYRGQVRGEGARGGGEGGRRRGEEERPGNYS